MLFFGRALITGAFAVTYVYTPEVYPTSIRSSATGIANCFSRAGGMIAPFVGSGLLAHGQKSLSLTVFACISLAASLASAALTIETTGRSMGDGIVKGQSVKTRSGDRISGSRDGVYTAA